MMKSLTRENGASAGFIPGVLSPKRDLASWRTWSVSWVDEMGVNRVLIGSLDFVTGLGDALAKVGADYGVRSGPFAYPMGGNSGDRWDYFWDTMRWLRAKDRFGRTNYDELEGAVSSVDYELPKIYELHARAA